MLGLLNKQSPVLFLLNNQPDALIIQIYSVIKLCISGMREHAPAHQTVNCSSILTLLGSGH